MLSYEIFQFLKIGKHLVSFFFFFFVNPGLAKENMPLLCGLWLKTIRYLKSFVRESFFFGAPVRKATQPAFGSPDAQN